jgi:uncharacterized protein
MQYCVADHKIKYTENSIFIYLTSHNAIFEIDSAVERILNDIYVKGNSYSQSTLLSHFPGSYEEKQNLFSELLQKKVLIPSYVFHKRKVNSHFSMNIPLQTLVLHLTNQCNLSCDYCYLFNDAEKITNVVPKQMKFDIAKRAVEFLLNNSRDQKDLTLVLFGGEPLLSFDVILKIVPYAHDRAKKYNKNINFSLTTNGSLLSREKVKFLVENNVGVTISIDGPPEIQNKHRYFRNGDPTYHSVTSNVKELIKELNGRPVVARSTIVDYPDNLEYILIHLLNLGFSEVGISPVMNDQYGHKNNFHYMNKFLNEFNNIAQAFLHAAKKDQLLGFSNIIDLLVTLHEGEIKDYPCGAGLNLFSVDPDGYLYLCQRFTGNENACMGDLKYGLDQYKINKFRKCSDVSQKSLCMNCLVRSICAGGCYYEAQLLNNGIFTPNQQYCHWINNWFDIGLDLYTKLLKSNPGFLDKLSRIRNKNSIFSDLNS